MEEWLILHLFYNALIPMSKTILDSATGGTIMGRPITEAKMLLDEMQENHARAMRWTFTSSLPLKGLSRR